MKLLILFILFLARSAAKKCHVKNRVGIDSCVVILQEYTTKVGNVQSWPDMKNVTLVKDFRNTCVFTSSCLTELMHCNVFGDEAQTTMLLNLTNSFCGLVSQVYSNSCFEQLTQKKSECVKNWHPILSQKQVNDEEKKRESCKNFFGEGVCVKKEITEKCGEEEWIKFRDHLLDLNKYVFKQCDQSSIVYN
ncbi:unnamed protein product [Caenorhabditis brenneri]